MNPRILFLLAALLIAVSAKCQALLLPNEEVVFTFKTGAGKKVMLAKDKGDAYIIYRFGTDAKAEFEYPEKGAESWKKFKYSSYMRGGGVSNEGMDLNYISFTNNGYQYVIFDTYYAVGNRKKIGVRVINLSTKKTVIINGIYKTRKGSIVDFRFNNKLEEGDELFD